MPCKSTRTLIHHFSSSPLLFEEKTPRPWTKASNPGRTTPQRNAPFESEFSLNLLLASLCDLVLYLLFVFSFSLDLLLEEIIGTEAAPEYISSDSSLEAEDAMPEQRINH
jgi:hypothetical protein